MSQKKVTIRGIARPIFLAILLSAMIAAVAGTPVSGPISRPMAANAALGPAPTGVRSGGPQSGTPANQSGAEAAQSLDPAAGSASTQGILRPGVPGLSLSSSSTRLATTASASSCITRALIPRDRLGQPPEQTTRIQLQARSMPLIWSSASRKLEQTR
jgi:hypothetical protein